MSYLPAIFVWGNIKKNGRMLLTYICMSFFKKQMQMSTNMHILVTPNKKKKASGYIYVLKQKIWKCIPHVLHKIYTILVYICLLFPKTDLGFGGISRLKNN